LNPVNAGDGGTLFLSGTHKANFPFPDSVREPDNPHLETYSCPAGSLFIFTESLMHAGTVWKNPDVDRVSIFYAYNAVQAQFHKMNISPEVISQMPPKRQSLFRGVWQADFSNSPYGEINRYYSEGNQAI
jgi:ectoine hydroxylase-related dioxygenase (phytanoyl-CoA dioxygenase family)